MHRTLVIIAFATLVGCSSPPRLEADPESTKLLGAPYKHPVGRFSVAPPKTFKKLTEGDAPPKGGAGQSAGVVFVDPGAFGATYVVSFHEGSPSEVDEFIDEVMARAKQAP